MSPADNINIEDINVEVTCLACKKIYGIQLKRPITRHNCRCGQGTFHIRVMGMKGRVELFLEFESANGLRTKIQPNRITTKE